jgi:hypothetical protein
MGTLRLRLALWHALMLSVILFVFAVLIYGVVRDQLIRHHDTNLTATARAVERVLSSEADCETLTDSACGSAWPCLASPLAVALCQFPAGTPRAASPGARRRSSRVAPGD